MQVKTLNSSFTSLQDFRGLPVGPFPQQLGWHAKGIVRVDSVGTFTVALLTDTMLQGALAGCIITALLGMATVIWYVEIVEVLCMQSNC